MADHRKLDGEDIEKLLKMRSEGVTLRNIGDELGISAERVRQIASEHDDYDEWLEKAQRRSGQRMRYQTDEELLDALRELDKEINGLPTCEQIREKIEYNEGTNILCKRFGSSIEACERAGLLREDNVIVNNGYSSFSDKKRREIRQDIEKANDRIDGGRLTCAKYNQVNAGDLCSISTIDMYYPSWCYALMDADLKPVQLPSPEAGKYTKADCMEAIQQANDKVNGSITVTQYRRVKRDCDPTFKTISRVTQMSWNELKRELGMEVNASKHDAKPD